jgi:hypothetical protein
MEERITGQKQMARGIRIKGLSLYIKRESLEDVGYGSGVRACARQRVVCSKPGKYPAAPQEVIPCHQSTIRRERLVAAAQVKLTAARKEFEIQFSFTQWVNQ